MKDEEGVVRQLTLPLLLCKKDGIPFSPLRGDVQKIMASETGRQFMQTGETNPLKSIRAIRSLLRLKELIESGYGLSSFTIHHGAGSFAI
jgi:hypothetical protein